MAKAKVILHAGMRFNVDTALRNNIFPNLDKITFVDERQDSFIARIVSKIFHSALNDYEFQFRKKFKSLKRAFYLARHAVKGDVLLLSFPDLSMAGGNARSLACERIAKIIDPQQIIIFFDDFENTITNIAEDELIAGIQTPDELTSIIPMSVYWEMYFNAFKHETFQYELSQCAPSATINCIHVDGLLEKSSLKETLQEVFGTGCKDSSIEGFLETLEHKPSESQLLSSYVRIFEAQAYDCLYSSSANFIDNSYKGDLEQCVKLMLGAIDANENFRQEEGAFELISKRNNALLEKIMNVIARDNI